MSNQLVWKRILVLAAAMVSASAFALWLSMLMSRHVSSAVVPSTPSLPKAVPDLQSRIETGDIRFSPDASILKDTKLFPLKSISLERTMCFGDCPIYIMTLQRDGRASLITYDIHDNQTKYYEAEVQPELLARATQLTQSAMRSAKKQEYAGLWTDDYSAIVRVQSESDSWCVSDYGQVAPVQVWALEELLHQFRNQIQWQVSPVHREARPYQSNPRCDIPRKNS
jgi:hypothetical protein